MKYQIDFHSYWHCGSGQASGADMDELVIKDQYGLPYIPGRTLKGLLRDAMNCIGENEETTNAIFGKKIDDLEQEQDLSTLKGKAHFSDALLLEDERAYLIHQDKKLKRHLYRSIASTAINDDGIAKDFSLRKIEVAVPCSLEGSIDGLGEAEEAALLRAMQFIKRMGLGRNRGLGRCTIKGIVSHE